MWLTAVQSDDGGDAMSGSMIEFAANGTTAGGYLAVPAAGVGPGVVVLQEWWGLVPQIKGVCDRMAAEGFTALPPTCTTASSPNTPRWTRPAS